MTIIERRLQSFRRLFAEFGLRIHKIRNADLYAILGDGDTMTDETPCYCFMNLVDVAEQLQERRDEYQAALREG